MTPEEIEQHEKAWVDLWGLLFSPQPASTTRQIKRQAESLIAPLEGSNIAYLMGQAIDLWPNDCRGAEGRMMHARAQLDALIGGR